MARNVTRRGGAPRPASSTEVDAFLSELARTPAPAAAGRGRLLFGLDATASREPTWDRACHIQAEMFKETEALGGLAIQLVYYRGFGECRATKWLTDPDALVERMVRVRCLGGRTQIRRVLRHAIKETRAERVNALVFVGDCCEEKIDPLADTAGQLGLLGVPAFMFHEGHDPDGEQAFRHIARLTGGAYCHFDAGSAKQLRDLLSAVAVFAAGGRAALEDFGRRRGGAVLQITQQVR